MSQLALFPLGVVLFPSVPLPLHIFEERYRMLVELCIEEQRDFGVIYHHGEEIEKVGCTAHIDQVIKRYDDGRLDILAIGCERFTVERIDDGGPYLQATVQFLREPPEAAEEQMRGSAVDAMLKYAYFTEMDLDRTALDKLTANQLSFLIAGIDALGMETKQGLLEINGASDRLSAALRALNVINDQYLAFARLKTAIGDDVDIAGLMN